VGNEDLKRNSDNYLSQSMRRPDNATVYAMRLMTSECAEYFENDSTCSFCRAQRLPLVSMNSVVRYLILVYIKDYDLRNRLTGDDPTKRW